MDYFFYAAVGIIILYFIIILIRRRKKKNDLFKSIDDVCIHLIKNHAGINYSNKHAIRYFGSIMNDEAAYKRFKSLASYSNKALILFFTDLKYEGTEDNLLIYKITKTVEKVEYIVVINDPVELWDNFSLNEVFGPFSLPS